MPGGPHGQRANESLPVLALFVPAISQASFPKAQYLAVATILCTGRRTVANLLRLLPFLRQGHPSCYNRFLSQDKWSGLQLATLLTRFLFSTLLRTGVIHLVGDDTVSEHRGKKVYGKGRHRDAVRSSHSFTAYRHGHKWVTLHALVQFPFASRPWALPILVALYRSPQDSLQQGRRHRTPAQRTQLLPWLLQRWYPDRQFVFAGDSGHGRHEMARFARKQKLTLVSKFVPDANLYERSCCTRWLPLFEALHR